MHGKIKEASTVVCSMIVEVTDLLTIQPWSKNHLSLESLAKSVIRVIRRTKNKYSTHVTYTLYSK